MSKTRRILEVFGEPISRGGQEAYVMNSLQHMDLSCFFVDFFTPYYCDNTYCKEFLSEHGGEIYVAGLDFIPGNSRKNVGPILAEYLKKRFYDVIHIHSGSISILAYCAKAAANAGVNRIIVHSHSSGINNNLKHKLVKAYGALFLKKYPTVWCACSMEAACWKYPESVISKVQILKNGIDLNQFQFKPDIRKEYRNRHGIAEKALVLGHVGRFTYEKNQVFLIELLKFFSDTHPHYNVRLMLVGDGEEKKRVEQLAKEKGINNIVTFIGSSDQISAYMQMFDIFLFPSLYEGLGIVGIEAQATGLPVVASTGVPKSIIVSDNIRFVSLNNLKAWSDAIIALSNCSRAKDNSRVKECGYDIHDTVQELIKLYSFDEYK